MHYLSKKSKRVNKLKGMKIFRSQTSNTHVEEKEQNVYTQFEKTLIKAQRTKWIYAIRKNTPQNIRNS
jgi:hypothetical protein